MINDLNFDAAFSQSKLKSHINCNMKTARNWSIVHDNSMKIEQIPNPTHCMENNINVKHNKQIFGSFFIMFTSQR